MRNIFLNFSTTEKYLKKAILAIAASCLCLVLILSSGRLFTYAAEEPAQTYYIRSASDFIAYSQAYASGSRNPKDVLNISVDSGDQVVEDGFISLGTQTRPFAGTLNVPAVGIDVFRLFDCPLFDYVTTDLKITGSGNIKIIRERASDYPAAGVLVSGSLFANHVLSGDSPANWSVTFLPYTGDGTTSSSFESLIGDIADNCDVTVTFTNNSNIPVSSAESAGLICGTLGQNASLAVTTAGSGSNISVTSTGGNAGGLVGSMHNGSTLKFNSANNSRVNSVSSTTAYAGGIVGRAENINVVFDAGVSEYAVSGTVNGKTGAGGLFGYYRNAKSPETFNLAPYSIASGMRMTGSSSNGGVFGYLDNYGASFTFDGNASGSEVFSVVLGDGTSRGGICGTYRSSALTNTFTVTNTNVSVSATSSSGYSGGLIGAVSANPAYILITDVTANSLNVPNAGIIGTIGSGGSFVDVTGPVKVNGQFDAGLIANMPDGVLRISGVTDFSTYSKKDWASGLIVKNRDRALVYALGDGEGNGWTLKRNTADHIDDIHSWGEVIRADGTLLAESDLFTVDMAAHTVTVKGAQTTISTLTDFAKTALNIKLNTKAAVGALQFTSGAANQSSTLLSGTITLNDDIDLAGSGLLGFTRDDGANAAFSGTLNGGGHEITLAIGETYGLNGSGNTLSDSGNYGSIHRHLKNGLFAKTNNATVQNLTIGGFARFYDSSTDRDGEMHFGGLTAYATGGLDMNRITANYNMDIRLAGAYTAYFGGLIGHAHDDGLDISLTNSTVVPTVVDRTDASVSTAGTTHVGGVISLVDALDGFNPQSVSFSDSTIGINYTKSINTSRPSFFGGAIAKISDKNGATPQNYVKGARTVSFDNVNVNVNATGTATERFGAILGTQWYNADVTIDGVTVDSAITATTGGPANYGGLVQVTTGYWNIKDISLTKADFTLPASASSTFGFVTNKSYSSNAALYIDVDNTANHYDISALRFTSNPGFGRFDEIVGDCRYVTDTSTNSIENNGNSIVSVKTSGDIINTSGSYNTYLNKTAYGQTAAGAVNPYSRYYYNIDYARANTATAKYDFLVWSVKEYAHSSLAAWFPSSTAFSGDLDMTGLSYYPVNLRSGITFNNATVKLDNNLMEANVKYAYAGNDTRTTRSNTNQHYLMHTAVFQNATAALRANGLTLQGNVPKLSDSFCGFLAAKTLGGSEEGITNWNIQNLVCDGVYVSNAGAYFTDGTYAPLLINNVGKSTTLKLLGAEQSTTAYSAPVSGGKYAGSSLIGDVGNTAARAIYLTFSGLKFDARTTHAAIGNLDTVYGTERSIFSRATILNSYRYYSESSGIYNYEIGEDWASPSSAVHNVTYGKEVTDSVEYLNKQKKYYGSEYYTHPTAYNATSEYSFSSGWRPYVYTAYNLGEQKHELSVNVTFNSVIEGCGKYGDPYIIDDDAKLPIISNIIAGGDVGTTVQICLPSDLTSFNWTATGYTKYLYNFDTATFTSSNGGANQTNPNVRKYLAGAHYVITTDITLPADYIPLGTVSSATDTQYAFRGVILGISNPTITNNSRSPLILTSHGSVVKDLTVDVAVDYDSHNVITLSAPAANATFNYINGIQTYGAVIGQILGGDNFIDDVHVTFSDVSFAFTTTNSNTNFSRLNPVGGYVGTLVNGGLIFRNMTAEHGSLTSAVCDKVADSGYLYVNPIIGRVIAGYAFHETTAYHSTEATTTLKNGNKNYSISDLTLSGGKLNITYSSSNFTVNIPDGQAMYILGAVVNSGAGSAAYNASTLQAYDSSNATNGTFWSAYRANTTVRGGGDYSAVGTSGFASAADYTDYALNDNYTSNSTKVPYIIRAYTNKTGNIWLARNLCTSANIILKVTGNCDVAAGFRGIGSIYFDNDLVRLRVKSMTSDGSTNYYRITLNMSYLEYDHTEITASNYIARANTAGIGLFTNLVQSNASETNSINKLVLSGSVFYDLYHIKTGAQSTYLFGTKDSNSDNDDKDGARRGTHLAAGGLAGFTKTKFYIKDVVFDNLTVEGAKYAAGLIGYGNAYGGESTIKFTDAYETAGVTAGKINAIGGLCAGGLIGRAFNGGKTTIIGKDTGTDIIIGTITEKSATPTDYLNYFCNIETGAGGIIGTFARKLTGGDKDTLIDNITGATSSSTSMRTKITVNHINVKGENNAGSISVTNAAYSLRNYAGGIAGTLHNAFVIIDDCSVSGVDISATFAGGAIGRISQKYFLHITDLIIDGNNKANSITAKKYAGGVIGRIDGHDEYLLDIDSLEVTGYNIISSETGSNEAAAGGVVGKMNLNNKAITDSSNHIFKFNNIKVSNCLIETRYNNNNFGGTGGVVGSITKHSMNNDDTVNSENGATYRFKLSGYNILLDSNTIKHYDNATDNSVASTNQRIGEIVGNNESSSPVRFIGVSIQTDSYCGKLCGRNGTNDETFGLAGSSNFGNGQIVLANSAGVFTNTAFSGLEDSSVTTDNYTDVTSKSPYVTANPSITAGSVKLTSDGVAATVAGLPVKTILTEGTTGQYGAVGKKYYTGSSGLNNLSTFDKYDDRFVMFSSEVTGYLDTDFPVLILDTTDHNVSHEMINSYLRIITNTDYNYGVDVSNNYSVHIYNMSYSGNTFTPSVLGASLKRSDGEQKFYMTNNIFDSGKLQFSLIDLRFANPANATETAYHLYVPVFVKKVLSYEFDIAVRSNTSYLESNYTPYYGEALIENVGTPVTLFFKYTYTREDSEWEEAANGGEKLDRRYAKQLQLYKANTNEVIRDFPADTVLVLVDKNRGGKPYYATFGDAVTGNTLNLSAFRSVMTKTGGTLSFSGESFVPLTLSEMLEESMTVTVSSSASGTLVTTNTPAETTFTCNGQGYRLATDEELEDGGVTKYTVSVTAPAGAQHITESYYISAFTESNAVNDLLFHYYLITAPSAFSETDYPARISNSGAHSLVHLVMGKIFYHDDLTVTSTSENGSAIMTASNNELTIDLGAQLGLSDDLSTDIKSYIMTLISNREVYHSFVVFLNRNENDDVQKVILGSPDNAASAYSIDTTLNGTPDNAMSAYSTALGNVRISQNFAEYVSGNLSSVFATGEHFEIHASVTLSYSAAAIPTQFPARNVLYPNNGVTVSGSSHIAFDSLATTYTKNVVDADETPAMLYYSEGEPEVARLDLNPLGDKLGDFTPLGVNALTLDGTVADMDLLATLDITPVIDRVSDYTDALVKISVAQKQTDGTYSDPIDISDYFTASFADSSTVTDEDTYYQAIIPRNSPELVDNGAEITLPLISLHVKTGSLLEGLSHKYANYQVTVTVVLRNNLGTAYSVSRASNYVIYTNAKILPYFIEH